MSSALYVLRNAKGKYLTFSDMTDNPYWTPDLGKATRYSETAARQALLPNHGIHGVNLDMAVACEVKTTVVHVLGKEIAYGSRHPGAQRTQRPRR